MNDRQDGVDPRVLAAQAAAAAQQVTELHAYSVRMAWASGAATLVLFTGIVVPHLEAPFALSAIAIWLTSFFLYRPKGHHQRGK
jgi:hypothetical protein